MNPLPCFRSVICFRVCRFSRNGIHSAPGTPALCVQLSLFLFGELVVCDELFHLAPPDKSWCKDNTTGGALQEVSPMPYRKVGYLEQCWYIVRYMAKDTGKKMKKCLQNRKDRAPTRDAPGSRTGSTAKSTEKK